jgi:hypothetical protein
VKKERYKKFCNDPQARKAEGFKLNGSHFFCGVESSGRDTVSTVTGTADDKMVVRISTWKGAIEIESEVIDGETHFFISLRQHAGSGQPVNRFCSGILGDKDSIILGS